MLKSFYNDRFVNRDEELREKIKRNSFNNTKSYINSFTKITTTYASSNFQGNYESTFTGYDGSNGNCPFNTADFSHTK